MMVVSAADMSFQQQIHNEPNGDTATQSNCAQCHMHARVEFWFVDFWGVDFFALNFAALSLTGAHAQSLETNLFTSLQQCVTCCSLLKPKS